MFFFFNDTATTEIYTLSLQTLFRSKTGNWALLAFVSRARLDAFTKVKEAMDKLMAELKTQQQEEVEKHDLCKKEIDQTEDDIKVAQNEKEDLEEKNKDGRAHV